jgi:hypothetical protein
VAILLSSTFANGLLAHDATAGQSAVADQFGGGTLLVYSGTPPTGPNESLSGNTVLATFAFQPATAWSAPATGVQNLDFVAQTVTATATGTGTFFRALNSGGSPLLQGTVGASGADFNLSSVSITAGDNVAITGTPTIAWTTT